MSGKHTIRGFIVAFSVCISVVFGEEEGRISFVTTHGESIESAKILRVEPDGVSLMHSHGITKIPIEQLPDDLKTRFNLNADTAARYRTAQAAAQQARAAQARRNREQQLEKERRLENAKQEAQKAKRLQEEVEKAKRSNYVWHCGPEKFTGRVLLVDNGNVLIRVTSHAGGGNYRLCSLCNLPPSERELAQLIGQHLTPEEKRSGELALYQHHKYVADQEEKKKREAARAALDAQNAARVAHQEILDAIRSPRPSAPTVVYYPY